MVESRLAQIALQGPCAMQNWKKYMISEDLCVWHVGICDRFQNVVRFAYICTKKNATNEATGYNIVAPVCNFLRLHKPHATGCFDKPVQPHDAPM